MCFGVLTTSIFNHRGLWCSLLSWFTLEADEVQIFSGVALTLCCMAAFLLSGKQSSSPGARQNCCFSSGVVSVPGQQWLDSSSILVWAFSPNCPIPSLIFLSSTLPLRHHTLTSYLLSSSFLHKLKKNLIH